MDKKSIATIGRNLLNKDEILRMTAFKLIVSLRGNNPLILDKVIYIEHSLARKLKDSHISDYVSKWTRNNNDKATTNEKHKKKEKVQQEKIGWSNF